MIKIENRIDNVVISGSRGDLLKLSQHIEHIANAKVGKHIHLDNSNFFDESDCELIIEKIEEF